MDSVRDCVYVIDSVLMFDYGTGSEGVHLGPHRFGAFAYSHLVEAREALCTAASSGSGDWKAAVSSFYDDVKRTCREIARGGEDTVARESARACEVLFDELWEEREMWEQLYGDRQDGASMPLAMKQAMYCAVDHLWDNVRDELLEVFIEAKEYGEDIEIDGEGGAFGVTVGDLTDDACWKIHDVICRVDPSFGRVWDSITGSLEDLD